MMSRFLNGFKGWHLHLAKAEPQQPQESAEANTQTAASEYSRTNPFYAEVLENINLNGRGSNKETRHLELSLEGSGLVYEPGDSLGIYPTNDPALVDELIKACGWDAEEAVTVHKTATRFL